MSIVSWIRMDRVVKVIHRILSKARTSNGKKFLAAVLSIVAVIITPSVAGDARTDRVGGMLNRAFLRA